MFSRFKKIFDKQTDSEPKEQNISDLIKELEQGVLSAEESIKEAKKNESKLRNNINLLFKDYDSRKSTAKKLLKEGQKKQAEPLLKKINLLKRQINEYGVLLSNVENTILELEEQKAHFEIKKEEFASKELMYQMKIKGAQNHADLNETILSTLNYEQFSSYENMLSDANAKAEAIAEINEDFHIGRSDTAVSAVSDLENEINLEAQKKEEEAFAKQKSKIDSIFNNMKEKKITPPTSNIHSKPIPKTNKINNFFSDDKVDNTKERLKSFIEQQDLEKSKQNKISNFFKD